MTRPAARLSIAALVLLATACAPARPLETASSTSAATGLTTTTTTTVAFAPTTLPAGTTVCDLYGEEIGRIPVDDRNLTEVSGIAVSRAHPGVVWAHNDSGDAATIYAIDTAAGDVRPVDLEGAFAIDFEDMALGPGPAGGDHLYVGDIGDNFEFRSEVTVYRLLEPDPGTATSVEPEALFLRYPDGPHDAEALAVDPITTRPVIVTKGFTDGRILIFEGPPAQAAGTIGDLELVAELDLGPGAQVTGADFSPDGQTIALRGYHEVWMWTRFELALAGVFAEAPCLAFSPQERQGEAIAFDATGANFLTMSEGRGSDLHIVGDH